MTGQPRRVPHDPAKPPNQPSAWFADRTVHGAWPPITAPIADPTNSVAFVDPLRTCATSSRDLADAPDLRAADEPTTSQGKATP